MSCGIRSVRINAGLIPPSCNTSNSCCSHTSLICIDLVPIVTVCPATGSSVDYRVTSLSVPVVETPVTGSRLVGLLECDLPVQLTALV